MKSVNHCFEYLSNRRAESLSSGLSGLRTSDASSVRRLMMSCSVDGMKPFDRALSMR